MIARLEINHGSLKLMGQNAGTGSLRILHVEDDEHDSEIVLGMLQDEGFDCKITRVDTRRAFEASLQKGGWDLVLSDYSLPWSTTA